MAESLDDLKLARDALNASIRSGVTGTRSKDSSATYDPKTMVAERDRLDRLIAAAEAAETPLIRRVLVVGDRGL
jgi:hypothetical protein